jgi:hypothetical protein
MPLWAHCKQARAAIGFVSQKRPRSSRLPARQIGFVLHAGPCLSLQARQGTLPPSIRSPQSAIRNPRAPGPGIGFVWQTHSSTPGQPPPQIGFVSHNALCDSLLAAPLKLALFRTVEVARPSWPCLSRANWLCFARPHMLVIAGAPRHAPAFNPQSAISNPQSQGPRPRNWLCLANSFIHSRPASPANWVCFARPHMLAIAGTPKRSPALQSAVRNQQSAIPRPPAPELGLFRMITAPLPTNMGATGPGGIGKRSAPPEPVEGLPMGFATHASYAGAEECVCRIPRASGDRPDRANLTYPAASPQSGKRNWLRPKAGLGSRGVPPVREDVLFVASPSGLTICCLRFAIQLFYYHTGPMIRRQVKSRQRRGFYWLSTDNDNPLPDIGLQGLTQPGLRPQPNLRAQRRGGAEEDKPETHFKLCVPAPPRET